ncbi:hypothetical protein TIFTF001_015563 [Ficus carica]|uniref:Uncharacterized protein n=1 Tax=Ficus carica TaxID=3494 RepID=A0AA88DIN7_FICCA|nr:hypothetical protein TIFTF001_015563 [Ficus carica]
MWKYVLSPSDTRDFSLPKTYGFPLPRTSTAVDSRLGQGTPVQRYQCPSPMKLLLVRVIDNSMSSTRTVSEDPN